jgi:hypothetical protein
MAKLKVTIALCANENTEASVNIATINNLFIIEFLGNKDK